MDVIGSGGARVVDAVQVEALLDYPSLAERVRDAFLDTIECPPRLVLSRGVEGRGGTTLVMAASRRGGLALVKVVTVIPGAPLRSHIVLVDADGCEVARLDGEALTRRRTAAASVLAASVLARADSPVLAIIGAGPQARAQAEAFVACRPIRKVVVWARDTGAATALARVLPRNVEVEVAPSLAEAVGQADVVSAATRAEEPLVRDADVRPGTHVDLVGGFRPTMREADDALVARARVVADTPTALDEAGDLAGPLARGVVTREHVRLLAGVLAAPPSRGAAEVTLFKSVGFAALDLVAAELALERLASDKAL